MPSWFRKFFSGGTNEKTPPDNLFPSDCHDFHDNPYPYYERLRNESPFYRTPDGAWVISRYADIKSALDHPSLGNVPSRFSTLNASKSDRFVCANLANNIMPFLDGLPHKEQRRLVARVFQKEVKAFTPQLEELARNAVNGLSEEVNAISDFAHPFALEMICGILGIPADPKLRIWSSSFFYLFTKIPTTEVREEVDHHLAEFRHWVADQFDHDSKTGVLAALADLVRNSDLSRAVAIDTLILLFADGLENVDSGLGNALLAFSENPREWERLRQDKSLLKPAVDEILRFDSPAQYIARTCLEDFDWNGHSFKKDITVILLLASANRDSRAFESPDKFDISRLPNAHLSFGHGKHSCLGSRLVELELATIFAELRQRVTQIRALDPIVWQKRTGHRWMEEGRFQFEFRSPCEGRSPLPPSASQTIFRP